MVHWLRGCVALWARWVRENSLLQSARPSCPTYSLPARRAERRPARLVVLSREIKLHRFASVVTVARSCGHLDVPYSIQRNPSFQSI